MKYEKPKCECGEELVFEKELVYTQYYKITKDGKIYEKPFQKTDCYRTGSIGILICLKCGNEYEWTMQKEDSQIIRHKFIW